MMEPIAGATLISPQESHEDTLKLEAMRERSSEIAADDVDRKYYDQAHVVVNDPKFSHNMLDLNKTPTDSPAHEGAKEHIKAYADYARLWGELAELYPHIMYQDRDFRRETEMWWYQLRTDGLKRASDGYTSTGISWAVMKKMANFVDELAGGGMETRLLQTLADHGITSAEERSITAQASFGVTAAKTIYYALRAPRAKETSLVTTVRTTLLAALALTTIGSSAAWYYSDWLQEWSDQKSVGSMLYGSQFGPVIVAGEESDTLDEQYKRHYQRSALGSSKRTLNEVASIYDVIAKITASSTVIQDKIRASAGYTQWRPGHSGLIDVAQRGGEIIGDHYSGRPYAYTGSYPNVTMTSELHRNDENNNKFTPVEIAMAIVRRSEDVMVVSHDEKPSPFKADDELTPYNLFDNVRDLTSSVISGIVGSNDRAQLKRGFDALSPDSARSQAAFRNEDKETLKGYRREQKAIEEEAKQLIKAEKAKNKKKKKK